MSDENVALDFGSYKTAPAGFRIWASGLIEKSDIEALIPWLDWAYDSKNSGATECLEYLYLIKCLQQPQIVFKNRGIDVDVITGLEKK